MNTFTATKPASYYDAPSPEEMQTYLRHYGMGELQDIEAGLAANHAASHHLRNAPIQHSFVDPTTTPDPQRAATLQSLLESVNFSTLSGKNPTEMAAGFAAAINSEQGGLDQIVNKVKQGRESVEQIAQRINQKMAGVQKMAENDFAKDVLGIPDIPEVALARLDPEMKAILMAMAQIQKLGFIQAKKKTAPMPDLSGNIIKPEDMEFHEQLPELWSPEIIVDPQFDIRFLTMELEVEARFKTHDVRQVADLLIDRSYSMLAQTSDGAPWKQGFVKAILLFYMDLVKKGTTTLYVSTFETKADGHVKIETELEARQYYNQYRCAGGGGTDINRVIREDQESISHNKLGKYTFHRDAAPEVIVINDGQDSLDPHMKTNAPVHSITLEEDNPDLKTLCEKSGGSYTRFKSPNYRDESSTVLLS